MVLGDDPLKLHGEGRGGGFGGDEVGWWRGREGENTFCECSVCELECVYFFDGGGVRDTAVPEGFESG